MDQFLVVLHNYLGERYNLKAVTEMFWNQLKEKLNQSQDYQFSLHSLKHSNICTDAILYALCRAHPQLEATVHHQLPATKFGKLGYFLPDEVRLFLSEVPS